MRPEPARLLTEERNCPMTRFAFTVAAGGALAASALFTAITTAALIAERLI